jgi:hypothetical protein
MPRLRAIAAALLLGVGVGAYLQAWVGWPTFVAVAVGALMAVVILLVDASLQDDAGAADAAWREASADLVAQATIGGPDDDDVLPPSARVD